MAYDAVNMADWQISEAAEKNMPTPEEWGEKLGLAPGEVLPMGRLAKLDFLKIIDRLKDKPDGKYIEVTAITPTPLGEGKSTTSCGLMEGLGKRGMNVGGALRQPSGGPTMNVKGTAAGGGNSLLIPMTEFSLGLTGDINDIMNAHNLAMVAMTSRMQHERNYNDEQLARLTKQVLDVVKSEATCRQLMTSPGIGPLTALTYRATIDQPERFARSRHVGTHLGLTPSRHQSGETDITGKISRCGDELARTCLVEAAHTLLVRSSKWSSLRVWGLAVARRRGMARAKIAVARKLAVILHRMWIDGTDFRFGKEAAA